MKDYDLRVIGTGSAMNIVGPMMYTPEQSATPIIYGMDIPPSLSEIVTRAFYSLMPVAHYRHSHEHIQ